MLLVARRLKEISFSGLMNVYRESNEENAADFWPDETPGRRMALAEQDFYDYLSRTFFAVPGAFYALWEEDGQYVSALRMEPYQDGFLLEALETEPDRRRKGYARRLILEVLNTLDHCKVYSHVNKRNQASLRTHETCGFQKILDHAIYADGSVLTSSVTMKIEI